MAQYDGSIRILTEISTKTAKKSLATLSNTIVLTAKEISSLRSKMDALKGQKFYTDDYKKLQSDLDSAEKSLAELVAKQNEWKELGVTSGAAWDAINQKIAEASNNVDSIKGKIQQLEDSGKAFILGENTQEYANLERQLQYEEEALRKAKQLQEIAQRTGDPYARLSKSLNDLNSTLSKIRHPIEAVKSSFAYMAEYMKAKLAGIAASIINGIVHPFQTMKTIASRAISGTSKLLSGMASVAKKVGLSIKGIASKLLSIGKSSKSASGGISSMGMGFKNLLKYGLGIRSLYALVNKVRSAIKQGFSNLYNDANMGAFKNSVDGLRASLLTLQNSFAAAFRPLVEIAIPYIQKAIQYITALTDKIGQFLAAITGQKTYTKAVQQTAKAFEDTADATKDAKKAAEGYLSPLDEINKFQSSDNNASDKGAGASSGGAAGTMFEEAPIESRFEDFAKRIKEMWKKADFTELGAILGQKLKDALDNINWEPIKEAAAKIGKSLATLINGFVSVEGLPETIGKTIGEAINTGIIGVNAFLDNTNFEKIGDFIGKGLNSLVNTIDWEELGHMFAQGINAAFETLGSFSAEFDWSNFGTSVGKGASKAIKDFNWKNAGASLGKFVTGLFKALKSFIDKTDWKELGKGITTAISNFLGNIDWGTIGGTISSFAIGILDFLTGLIEGVDWSSVPQGIIDAISDFFTGFDYVRVFGSFGEFIGTAIAAGIDLLSALGDILSDAWDDVIEYFSGYIEGKSGWEIIQGLYNGIIDAINGIVDWIRDNIFLPFIDGLKKAFGIHSPSTVMAEQGKYIILGLLEGLKNNINSVLEWLKNIPKWFKEKFVEAYNFAKDAFSGIGTWFSDRFTDVKNAFSNVGSWFKDKFSIAWENIKDVFTTNAVSNFFSGVWSGIKNAFGNIAGWFKDKFSAAWQAVKDVFSSGGEVFGGIKDGILKGLKDIINFLIDGINKVIKEPFDGLNSALKTLKKVDIAGFKPFDGLPTISTPQIPRLATGAVIPANREFLAVLGDQKHGTNIEAPEDLIRQIVREETAKNNNFGGAGGSGNLTLKVYLEDSQLYNPKKLFEAVIKEGKVQQMSSGKNRLLLEN